MALTYTPDPDLGSKAPTFDLPGTDGRRHSFESTAGENGTLVMFICNHCPYVKSIQERLVEDARELQRLGVGVIAIMANDPSDYPEDSFENMRRVAERFGYPFPYVIDETQEVARAYGAVCTPDFFGYDREGRLVYRGRLDAAGADATRADMKRDLVDAFSTFVETGSMPDEQFPSMGCSIKWTRD